MTRLALVTLVWLWPRVSSGPVEATAEPTLGLRASTVVQAVDVTLSAGTGYQSLRAGITVPPEGQFLGFRGEVQRLLRADDETHYRLIERASNRYQMYIVEDWALRKRTLASFRDRETGELQQVVQETEQSIYLALNGRTWCVRAGVSRNSGEVGVSGGIVW